jgi:hypothetical protein
MYVRRANVPIPPPACVLENASMLQVYKRIIEDDLAPPHLENGKIIKAADIDNKHLFAYALSARLPLVYAKLLKLDVESWTQVVKILALAEADMNRAPIPKYWTPVKVRRLFDASLRVLEAAAQAGFALWASLNLSSMRNQYKRHMQYRDERLQTSFPHGALEPDRHGEELLDEGWAMEENRFWRPVSPEAIVKTKHQKAREKDESLQRELAAAARIKHLEKIENWERMFNGLPVMEKTKIDEGTAEKLCAAVQGRLKLMHQVNKVREEEALANRMKIYKDAEALKDQLNRDLLPKLREYEDLVEALWKGVAPSELMDSVNKLEHESRAHAQDASNARDYVTARTLAEASERLGQARESLNARKTAANFMEDMAARTHAVATMRDDVEKLAAASGALPELNEGVQPPFELLTTAASLDLGIQKWVHQWTRERQAATKKANGSSVPTEGSMQVSRSGSSALTTAAGEKPASGNRAAVEGVPAAQEMNDKQRVADILSMQSLANGVAGSLKRLRWRQKICGFMLHPGLGDAPMSDEALQVRFGRKTGTMTWHAMFWCRSKRCMRIFDSEQCMPRGSSLKCWQMKPYLYTLDGVWSNKSADGTRGFELAAGSASSARGNAWSECCEYCCSDGGIFK